MPPFLRTLSVLVGLALGLRDPVFMAVEGLAIACFAIVDRWLLPYIDRFDRGAKGEEDVGAILDGLVERGWLPIHDVCIERGNADHIVVGPAGIFTVETKSASVGSDLACTHAGRLLHGPRRHHSA